MSPDPWARRLGSLCGILVSEQFSNGQHTPAAEVRVSEDDGERLDVGRGRSAQVGAVDDHFCRLDEAVNVTKLFARVVGFCEGDAKTGELAAMTVVTANSMDEWSATRRVSPV